MDQMTTLEIRVTKEMKEWLDRSFLGASQLVLASIMGKWNQKIKIHDETRVLDSRVKIRMKIETRNGLEKWARREGVSVASLVRSIVNEIWNSPGSTISFQSIGDGSHLMVRRKSAAPATRERRSVSS